MGFFKVLGYVAAGVGAVVLVPATGGTSLAVAIGALGTTTAAGAALGAAVGATAAAVDHAITSEDDAYQRGHTDGVTEGSKAAEASLSKQYNERIAKLVERLQAYHDFENKLLAMYALGLAVARCDGHVSDEEMNELNTFVSGCSAGSLPKHIKDTIGKMASDPPTLSQARQFMVGAELPYDVMEDLIYLVAMADGELHPREKAFMTRWKNSAVAETLA